jgi:hypothetical protein
LFPSKTEQKKTEKEKKSPFILSPSTSFALRFFSINVQYRSHMFPNNYTMTNNTTVTSTIVLQNNNITYYFVPFYTILFLIGTFGNGLVIISILRSSRLRTVTNTYLLNIAIADFVLLLSVPFLIVTILANGWIFGNVLCKMYYNFIHINQYVSSLLLAALSFDRYLAVCHPIRAIEFRTRTKCALIIAGMLIEKKMICMS